MGNYRIGSLPWHIARMWEKRRQHDCGATYYGGPEASTGHFASISETEIAAIDAELAEAVALMRSLGLVPCSE